MEDEKSRREFLNERRQLESSTDAWRRIVVVEWVASEAAIRGVYLWVE